MPFKAIFFDIDGTLVDSNAQHVSAWVDAFRRFGHDFERQAIHEQVGKGGDNLVPALLPGVSSDRQEELENAHGEGFRGVYRAQVRPFPGARDLVAHVRRDGKQAVLASSASREELDYWIELLQIGDLLTATTCRDDVEHSKPAPDIFGAALAKVAPLQPSEVLVIGDTPYDLSAAAKLGIPTVAVRSGGFPDDVMTAHAPLAIYDDVAALLSNYDNSPLSDRV